MAAVHLSKWSALYKCPACRLSYCTWKRREFWTIFGPRQLKIDQWSSTSLFWFPWIFPIFHGQTCFLFSLSWSYLKAHLRPREEWLCKGNWLIPRGRLIAKLETGEEKNCGKGLFLVGRRRSLEPGPTWLLIVLGRQERAWGPVKINGRWLVERREIPNCEGFPRTDIETSVCRGTRSLPDQNKSCFALSLRRAACRRRWPWVFFAQE